MGDLHRAPDQQPGTEDQQHQAGEGPEEGLTGVQVFSGQFRLHLLVQGIRRFAQALPGHPPHDAGKDGQQGPGIQAGDGAIPDLPGGQGGDAGQDG